MKISVFGLGYVGCVTAACLAKEGHTVIGVDVNPDKVNALKKSRSPIVEPGLLEHIGRAVSAGKLAATTEAHHALMNSELSIICVGTPSRPNGDLDTAFVQRVCREIGLTLRSKRGYHTVVLRSTVLPGTTEEIVQPILEQASGKRAGADFGLAFNPEFLREGTAIKDFFAPPRTVIGQQENKSGDTVASLYKNLEAPLVRTNCRAAEMVKYADNAFHAVKITFANEIGNLCRAEGIDSHEVMKIFCLDKKLNLSATYLQPGYAFGGSCLPKDLRALLYRIKTRDLSSPLCEAILPSNELQKSRAVELVRSFGKNKIGVLGLSFKSGTDDLRESPTVGLIETLVGKGCNVSVYDPNVSLANLVGANKAYIEQQLPHIASLMSDSMEKVLAHAEVAVVATREAVFAELPRKLRAGQVLVDLVRLVDDPKALNGQYHGIAW
jgi:GDP-mannose 6-dehydrogenase